MRKHSKGFSLIELLIVVAIILIIAAIAIPNLLRSRISANEASAVSTLTTLNSVCVQYQTSYGGYPPSIAALGPAAGGGAASAANADLIDSALATGTKNGYTFTYAAADADGNGTMDTYTINADPVTVGTTGQRFFFTDQSGVKRANPAAKASATDPAI